MYKRQQQSWTLSYKRLTEGRGNLLSQAHKLSDLGAKARRNLPSLADEGEENAEEKGEGETGPDQ